jgi:hypothetical protein
VKLRGLTSACLFLVLLAAPVEGRTGTDRPYFRGGLYFDWFGAKYEGTDLANRFSLRLKGEFLNRRGEGWSLLIDTRDRLRLGEAGSNHVLLYDARLSFERAGSPWYLALGQMNLYDTAGIGQLLGGVAGFKLKQYILVGGYAGMESSVYVARVSQDYSKFGVFARWMGARGKRVSLSFNQVQYSGEVERRYVYVGSLLPVNRSLVLYGNVEYELAAQVRDSDRLSRFFANLRWDPLDVLDLLVHFSSGKGMDFHRYAVEQSKNPSLNDQGLERFYYSQQYGMRLSLKPKRGIRFYVERRESEQKDAAVRNHTWRFGASGLNMFRSGISVYGNYALRRGEISESDSYYLSVTRDFGRISWNVSFSNTFNGVRFDSRTGVPELIHLDDHKTASTYVFAPITRVLAVSLEYEYFLQREADQHMFFMRLILRN